MVKISSLNYVEKIKTAYKSRPRQIKPEIFLFSGIMLAAVFAFISFSVFIHPEGERFCYNFYLEVGSISILSATTLTTAALIAYISFFISPKVKRKQKIFFLIAAIALTYLAVDEVMQFHENIGTNLDHIRFFRKLIAWTGVHSWNDMIIIIYGLVALPVLIYVLPTIFEVPYIAEYFVIAFICYVIHTTIDASFRPPTTASYIFEESAKLYTSTFMALGLLSGLQFLIKSRNKIT